MEKEVLVMSIASACFPGLPKVCLGVRPRFLVAVLCCAVLCGQSLVLSGAAVCWSCRSS